MTGTRHTKQVGVATGTWNAQMVKASDQRLRRLLKSRQKDILQHTVSSAGAVRGYPHSKHAAAGVPVHHLPLPERRLGVAPAPPAGAPCPRRPTTKQAATQHWAGPAAHVYAAGASCTGQVDVLPRAAPATAAGHQPSPSTATISVTQCSLLVAAGRKHRQRGTL